MKKMTITEFRELGLLQEINRQVLHPMGLALAVKYVDGKEVIDCLIDARDDPEGMCFDNEDISVNYYTNFYKLFNEKRKNRIKYLGYHVQPIQQTKKGI